VICTDSADAISKDLVEAGLIDGKNMVVGKLGSVMQDHILYINFIVASPPPLSLSAVAANIQKLVENPSTKKVVFPIVSH
jgi:hypothetical protein